MCLSLPLFSSWWQLGIFLFYCRQSGAVGWQWEFFFILPRDASDVLNCASWGGFVHLPCSSAAEMGLIPSTILRTQYCTWKGMLQLDLPAKAVQSQAVELRFQDSRKFLRSCLIQSSCRRCACCAPSELEVAAFASLLCELKYCPTLTLAYAWISSLR